MGSGFSTCGNVSVTQSLRSLNDPEVQRKQPQKRANNGSHFLMGNINIKKISNNDKTAPVKDSNKNNSEDICRSNDSLNGKPGTKSDCPSGLSDSCDSGIYEGHKGRQQQQLSSRSTRNRISSATAHRRNNSNGKVDDSVSSSGAHLDTRYNRPVPGTMRSNPRSAPNLQQLAIDEVDEDEEAFALRMSRPVRPKSAHVRRKRGSEQNVTKSRTELRKRSDGESSEFSDDDDWDSDLLSIPDETNIMSSRTHDHTNVKLGPKFNQVSRTGSGPGQGQDDWWTGITPLDDNLMTSRSTGSFLSRVVDNNFAKKASLSSVILSPIECPEVSSPRAIIYPSSQPSLPPSTSQPSQSTSLSTSHTPLSPSKSLPTSHSATCNTSTSKSCSLHTISDTTNPACSGIVVKLNSSPSHSSHADQSEVSILLFTSNLLFH